MMCEGKKNLQANYIDSSGADIIGLRHLDFLWVNVARVRRLCGKISLQHAINDSEADNSSESSLPVIGSYPLPTPRQL